MQWSQVKKQVETTICPKLKNRIKVDMTRYRCNTPSNHNGRLWISLDNKIIYEVSEYQNSKEWNEIAERLDWEYRDWPDVRKMTKFEIRDLSANAVEEAKITRESVDDILWEQNKYTIRQVIDSLKQYLVMSYPDALLSANFIIKALAITDKRLGKRRLEKIQLTDNEHPLVMQLYNLRCEVEII